jgi:hypothetical protein
MTATCANWLLYVDVQEGDGNCSLPPVAMEQREARGCSLQGMEFNSIEERRCQR